MRGEKVSLGGETRGMGISLPLGGDENFLNFFQHRFRFENEASSRIENDTSSRIENDVSSRIREYWESRFVNDSKKLKFSTSRRR